VSVGLSVTVVNSGKTTELIEMPFGLWTRVGRRNHMLAYMGVYEKGHFSGGGRRKPFIVKCRDRPYRPCAAAMRPFYSAPQCSHCKRCTSYTAIPSVLMPSPVNGILCEMSELITQERIAVGSSNLVEGLTT